LDTWDRERVIKALFTHWAELAPEAAANRALAATSDHEDLMKAVVAEWAARDPAALWAWAQAHDSDVSLGDVAAAIAAHDPPRAWKWMCALSPAAMRDVDMDGLFEQWGRRDGAEAFRVALGLGDHSRDAVSAVLQGWGESN